VIKRVGERERQTERVKERERKREQRVTLIDTKRQTDSKSNRDRHKLN
jgi:hypothetical protein